MRTFLDGVEMSRDEETQLRRCLRSWYKTEQVLTNESIYSESTIKKLLLLESKDRKRVTVLTRLHARYSKLRKEREWRELNLRMNTEVKYEGVRHRKVLG